MSEARQRWRLIVARGEAALDLTQREVSVAWEAALRISGLPLAETDGTVPRLRVAFGAPVPVGMFAEREPIDVALFERRRIHEVREWIEPFMPTGYRLVDLYDVWPGAPTLAASIVAGDYRAVAAPVEADGGLVSRDTIEAAVAGILQAPRLVRRREKAGAIVEVDIRPHILDLRVAEEARDAASAIDDSFALLMRLRLGGEGGVGRPDEIVAALADRLDRPLATRRLSRERVILTDGAA